MYYFLTIAVCCIIFCSLFDPPSVFSKHLICPWVQLNNRLADFKLRNQQPRTDTHVRRLQKLRKTPEFRNLYVTHLQQEVNIRGCTATASAGAAASF